jgi:hypothetical protein
MHMHITLGTAALAFSLLAQADSPIEPHVDPGGVVSWTATIDAETVNEFIDTASGAVEQDSRRIAALGRWLDVRLAAVSWCRHGWMYQTSDEHYIEPLEDGRLRVRGVCHAENHGS